VNKPKQRGTAWETVIVNYLREHGAVHAERRTLAGSSDRGDIAGIPGVVIEAKAVTRFDPSTWLKEAEIERINDHSDVGLVWAKRRGKTSPGAAYVIMTGETLMTLLWAAGYVPIPATLDPGDPSPDN